MKLLAAVVAALALAAPAAAAGPPEAGLLVPGRSLGGVALGAPIPAVLRAWGRSFGVCTDCAEATWYFNFVAFRPQGAGVEFRNGHVAALFTLWSPPGWRTSGGLVLGDPVAAVTSAFGPLVRRGCHGYYALQLEHGGSTTSFYVVDGKLWGFGLSERSLPSCR